MPLTTLDIVVVYPEQDAEVGSRIAGGLRRLEHRVHTAHDAERALQLVDHVLPEAVVSTELSPPLDAVELCWAVRKTSRAPNAVFVVVGDSPSTNKRIQAFRTGVDLYLSQPVSVHGLSAFLQAQAGLRTGVDVPDTILAGHLARLGLLEVLQIALNAGWSGRLDLWSASGSKGRIYIRKGQPVYAAFGEHKGREALQDLAALRDGAFRFVEESQFPEANIAEPGSQLILDLARILDEETRL